MFPSAAGFLQAKPGRFRWINCNSWQYLALSEQPTCVDLHSLAIGRTGQNTNAFPGDVSAVLFTEPQGS